MKNELYRFHLVYPDLGEVKDHWFKSFKTFNEAKKYAKKTAERNFMDVIFFHEGEEFKYSFDGKETKN